MSAAGSMKTINLGYRVIVPAGEYFLGDPCYAVPADKWAELIESWDATGMPVGRVQGFDVLAFHTASGDGAYYDCRGTEYPVDAGLIGLTPIALASSHPDFERLKTLGHMVTFDRRTECTERNGRMVFGEYEINTNDDEEATYD